MSGTLDAQVTFGYDAGKRLTGTTDTSPGGNTLTTSLGYDAASELTNVTSVDTTTSVTLASYTYGYNAGGELTSVQDNQGDSLTYGYDSVGELTSATGTLAGSSYSASYSYDPNGNRTMPGYETGTGNELLSDGTYSYTYDNEGNTTSQTDIATGSVTYYSYNDENELVGEKEENSQGQVLSQETFTYDVFGNQIGQDLNRAQQWTVYNGSNPYMQFNGSGQLQERYLANPTGLNQFYGQVGASGTTEWYLTDNLGSVRQVVSTSGSVLDALTFDPYGNLVTQTNSAYQPRFGYAGGLLDPLTGDYQFGARNYSPEDGRWESQDPLGFAAGDADLYGYIFNDPTTAIDPTGLDVWTSIGGVFRAATGLTEMTVGAGVFLIPVPPGPQIAGAVIFAHGSDVLWAGIQDTFEGTYHQTYTAKGLTWVNTNLWGMNQAAAECNANYQDDMISLVFTLGGAYFIKQFAPKPPLWQPPRGINSLAEANATMRSNLPPGMGLDEFGHNVMKWGGGNVAARARMATLTAQELRAAGVTPEMADAWAEAYEAIARITPNNPSAAGRAELMRRAAQLLRGS